VNVSGNRLVELVLKLLSNFVLQTASKNLFISLREEFHATGVRFRIASF